MAFTYGGDPANSALEKVRFLIGDTVSATAQLQDAEINFLLTESGNNTYLAASSACLAIAAEYGRLVDKEVGDLSIFFSQRQRNYLDLAEKLAKQAGKKSTPNLYAGGINTSDKDVYDDNTSIVHATFKRDMFTNQAQDTEDVDC